MSDPLEEADALTQLLLKESLRHRNKVPALTGFCLSCEEPTEGAFCSSFCREDYERVERIKAINGRK